MEKKLIKNRIWYKLVFFFMLPVLMLFGAVTTFGGKHKYRAYLPGVVDGELVIPGGTPYAADDEQKYPIGTILRTGGRTFVYCKAGGTCYPYWAAYKAKKTNTNAVAPAQATGAGTAGSYYVTVTIDTTVGELGTGVLSANELAGGFIVIGNGTNQKPQNRLIVSHPALATTGGSLTVKLDSPLTEAVTVATTNIELMASPYFGIKADGSGGAYVSFLGIPTVYATTGQFLWIQTWGPVWITSNGNTCDSADDRQIYFADNGSVVSGGDVTFASDHPIYQFAGVAIDMSGNGASNAPFVNLQISP